jgi:hypothetical protein
MFDATTSQGTEEGLRLPFAHLFGAQQKDACTPALSAFRKIDPTL